MDAVTVHGAAARLRGTEDRSEPQIAELTGNLRAALGEDFEVMFGRGMALDRPAAIARLLDPIAYTGLCADMARQAAVRARSMADELDRTPA